MTNQNGEKQQGSPPGVKTIFEYASEGSTFDVLPEEVKKEVRRADKFKDERDALAEIQVDQLFAEAAGVIREIMYGEDPKLALGAACEVFRMRAVTLKANKKRQTADAVAKRLFDGFNFQGSGS